MKLLILGGTVFLGRHLVDLALKGGHELTLFNRGLSNPDLYPEVETVRGDRDADVHLLAGRRWDAVIDTSGYFPRVVADSARVAAETCDHYTFISSISVYRDLTEPGIDEDAPVAKMEDESIEDVQAHYGPLKALCEEVVREVFSGPSLIIRPGLIVGPHDPSDRFTYWPHRVSQGGEVLVPGSFQRKVQFIDARDLAGWILRMVEDGRTGTYNATGPREPMTMIELLRTCRSVSGSRASFTEVDELLLLESGVRPWTELPLWLPEAEPGIMQANCQRALNAALTFRPLADTARNVLDWLLREPHHQWKAGMDPARERELLQLCSEAENG
ncbi:MAG: SDR family oxidoreductase [Bacillota bacterium]